MLEAGKRMAARQAGRVTEWNDDKGYGFVTPHEGGARPFVHIKAFQRGSRRPVEGDLISYETAMDAKGRANAASVRFAGQRIQATPPRATGSSSSLRRIPRRWLGALALAVVVAAAVMEWVPVVVPLTYGGMSFVSYLVYWWDKDAAGAKQSRVPEDTLHALDLMGGWPGALVAQQQYRHKTVKVSFQVKFWLTVVLNVAGAAWLLRAGHAKALMDMLSGG